jgi:hypothetical protein
MCIEKHAQLDATLKATWATIVHDIEGSDFSLAAINYDKLKVQLDDINKLHSHCGQGFRLGRPATPTKPSFAGLFH